MLLDPGRGAMLVPEQLYLFLAPTRPQAKNIYWNKLKQETKFFSKSISETELKITLLNDSVLYVSGLDKPERVEGITFPPIKGLHITEIDNCKPDIWGNNLEPLLLDNDGFAIIDGVPEGKLQGYEFAEWISRGSIPKTVPMLGAFAKRGDWSWHSWLSADVLDNDALEIIKQRVDEKTFRQEYEGSFETYEGLAYWAFSDKNLTDKEYDNNYPLSIGADFNVNPMCWAESQIIDGKAYFVGESILKHSNTYEMCDHIIDKYKLNRQQIEATTIYPDSTADSNSTNATRTDLDIIKKYGFKVKAFKQNPRQKRRIKTVNSALKPYKASPKVFINPKRCKNLVADMNKVETMADGRLNKLQESPGKSRVHMSDAFGYLIYYLYPIYESDGGWKY